MSDEKSTHKITGSRGHAPEPDNIPTLESLGVELHPDTLKYVENGEMLANAIGGNGESCTAVWPYMRQCGGLGRATRLYFA